MVAREIHGISLAQLVSLVRRREFGSLTCHIRLVKNGRHSMAVSPTHNDHEVPVFPLLHPFSNPLLRLLVLVVVRPAYP